MEKRRSIAGNRIGVSSFTMFWAMGLILFLIAVPVFAQLATGTILGVVKDTSGGTVPGAKVTVTSSETAQSRTVTTNDDGSYRFPGMPVGHYYGKNREGWLQNFNTEWSYPGRVAGSSCERLNGSRAPLRRKLWSPAKLHW